MKVDRPGSVGPASGARRSDKAGGARPGEFSRLLDNVGGPSSVNSASPLGSIDALLAAQSIDPEEGRKQARQRGDDILDRLDELRHGLLTGSLSLSQVTALAALVRSRRANIADPRLREVLDEIELRAEVEIAKLTAAPTKE